MESPGHQLYPAELSSDQHRWTSVAAPMTPGLHMVYTLVTYLHEKHDMNCISAKIKTLHSYGIKMVHHQYTRREESKRHIDQCISIDSLQ